MASATGRNGKIDFLRFFFSVLIILNHAKYFMPKGPLANMFKGYSFAVEFFFLVSGYLMMATIEKWERGAHALSLGRETGAFLFRKFKSVYPEMAIAYLFAVVVTAIATATNVFGVFLNSWSELLLLPSTGLRFAVVNPATWYISSMILCMVVLYPFIRKYKDMAVRVVLPVVALLILGYMCQNLGSLRNPTKWLGFTIKGNLRAFAELCLGVECYFISKRLKEIRFNKLGRLLLTVLETSIYVVYVLYMALVTSSLKDYLLLGLLCIAVSITFSGQGIESGIYNNRFCQFLGKYSLALYLGHRFYPEQLTKLFPFLHTWHYSYRFLFYLILSFATGLLIMILSDLLRKHGKRITTIFKRMIIKKA